jgi:hypothetical protein
MDIIDEDGRIFGVINVIDALVILLVLSVGVAGIALVTSGGESPSSSNDSASSSFGTETTTTYVTLDLGQLPTYVVSEIDEGDAVPPTGGINITITDTWVTPRKNGAQVFARLRVDGPQTDDQLSVQGGPLRLGRSMKLATPEYSTKGTLIARGDSSALSVSQTELTITDSVAGSTAEQITRGDTLTTLNHDVGSVESVSTSEMNGTDNQRVTLRVSVSTAEYGADRFYGGKVVLPGTTVPIQTDTYRLSGRVDSVGDTDS